MEFTFQALTRAILGPKMWEILSHLLQQILSLLSTDLYDMPRSVFFMFSEFASFSLIPKQLLFLQAIAERNAPDFRLHPQ
jgi:hypothetical protein